MFDDNFKPKLISKNIIMLILADENTVYQYFIRV